MRRSLAVKVETIRRLRQLGADLERLPPERLRIAPDRGRQGISASRVADEAIERGIRVLREEHGL
jgi:hypothetical protein